MLSILKSGASLIPLLVGTVGRAVVYRQIAAHVVGRASYCGVGRVAEAGRPPTVL